MWLMYVHYFPLKHTNLTSIVRIYLVVNHTSNEASKMNLRIIYISRSVHDIFLSARMGSLDLGAARGIRRAIGTSGVP